MAYEVGVYMLSFKTDKGPVQEKGKYVVVWKKSGNTWKVAADIFNSDGSKP
jgi:ketosteroid isomerase-like protein